MLFFFLLLCFVCWLVICIWYANITVCRITDITGDQAFGAYVNMKVKVRVADASKKSNKFYCPRKQKYYEKYKKLDNKTGKVLDGSPLNEATGKLDDWTVTVKFDDAGVKTVPPAILYHNEEWNTKDDKGKNLEWNDPTPNMAPPLAHTGNWNFKHKSNNKNISQLDGHIEWGDNLVQNGDLSASDSEADVILRHDAGVGEAAILDDVNDELELLQQEDSDFYDSYGLNYNVC